jgi:hypothetical protein
MIKHWVLCTLLLVGSIFQTFACGYYPFGEDIRYNLLRPEMVMPNQVNWFNYCSTQFYYQDYDFDNISKDQFAENIELWNKRFGYQFNTDDIFEAIVIASTADMRKSNSPNAFIRGLYVQHANAEINYIIFAKACSIYNKSDFDPWERSSRSFRRKRGKMIQTALKFAAGEKDEQLKRRYAYLALRMAFYQNDFGQLNTIYDHYFSNLEQLDAIDYWALHFKLQTEESSIRRSIRAALVFLHSSEKRFAVHRYFSDFGNIEELLQAAKTDDERIAIHYISACLTYEPALEHLEAIKQIDPTHSCLDFLALREINKMEDWILTPYYTQFSPSVLSNYDYIESERMQERIQLNRTYAQSVTQCLKQIQKHRINANRWWSVLPLYSQFMTRDFDGLSTALNGINTSGSVDLQQFVGQLKTLVSVADNQDPKLELASNQEVLMAAHASGENQLMLAIGRELEMNGNKVIAAAVYSRINEGDEFESVWKSMQKMQTLGDDYYYEYFTYLDAAYEIQDIQDILKALQAPEKNNPAFNHWCWDRLRTESMRLSDLIGTKYVRKNDWNNALNAFKQVDDTLWTSDHYAYKDYLDENPFSNDFYGDFDSRHQQEIQKSYTKPQLVSEIIHCLKQIETLEGDQKALAAYRLANCYRNMTFYGNAWMMRRYYWTANANLTGLEDDQDYFHMDLAKKYYLIAAESAHSVRFAALSTRMAGYCEGHSLYFEFLHNYLTEEEETAMFRMNKTYRYLEKVYPKDYDMLMYTCDFLPDYYQSIASK